VRYGPGGGRWDQGTGNTSGVFISDSGVGPSGSCTRGGNQFLPVFQVNGSVVTAFDCPNNVSTTTGKWLSWQYYPGTSEVAARTAPACQAGSTTACTSYTALVSDYYIAITTTFTASGGPVFTVTLPCASVPAGKIWIVGDEGGAAGTSSKSIAIKGAFLDTQTIVAGYTAKAYRSNGTSCFRLW
jgi:hypothetical protein